MNCREFREAIDGVMEGEKPGREMLNHAGECPSCKKELEAAVVLKESLSCVEKISIPDDFNSKVWKKIGVPSPSFLDRIFGAGPGAGFAVKGAVAAAALVFAVIFLRGNFEKSSVVTASKPVVVQYAKHVDFNNKNMVSVKKAPVKIAAAVNAARQDIIKNDDAQKPDTVVIATLPNESADKGSGGGPVKNGNSSFAALNLSGKKINSPGAGSNQGRIAASSNPAETPTTVAFKGAKMDGAFEVMSNVFNPLLGGSMKIKYEIKTGTDVSVIVYSRKGEAVKTLFRGFREPGIYEQSWNGTCDSGAVVGADIYFIYLKTHLVEKRIKAAVIK
jgi:hypothetical protein